MTAKTARTSQQRKPRAGASNAAANGEEPAVPLEAFVPDAADRELAVRAIR